MGLTNKTISVDANEWKLLTKLYPNKASHMIRKIIHSIVSKHNTQNQNINLINLQNQYDQKMKVLIEEKVELETLKAQIDVIAKENEQKSLLEDKKDAEFIKLKESIFDTYINVYTHQYADHEKFKVKIEYQKLGFNNHIDYYNHLASEEARKQMEDSKQ